MAGALFGAAFPVVAAGIRFAQGGGEGLADAVGHDPLLWIVATAPAFLGAFAALGGRQQDLVQALADGLEVQVAQRTASLSEALDDVAALSASQTQLLEGLEVGVVCFQPDGTLSRSRSAILEAWIPEVASLSTIDALLEQVAGVAAGRVALVRDLLWDPVFMSPFGPTTDMIRHRFRWNGRVLEPHFRGVHDGDGRLDHVMVQFVDHTEAEAAEASHHEAVLRLEQLRRVADAPEAFDRFAADTRSTLTSLGASATDTPDTRRALHTLKGNARSFGFAPEAEALHDLESTLKDEGIVDTEPVRARLHQAIAAVRDLTGRPEGAHVVRCEALDALAARIGPEHHDAVQALTHPPLERLWRPYAAEVERRAAEAGVTFTVSMPSTCMAPERAASFQEVVLHLLTNALTHGARGRDRVHVDLDLRCGPTEDVLVVTDDGAGIDLDALRARAIERGRWSEVEAERADAAACLELVFASGVSSAETVGDLAGRGEGMAAARAAMRARGGDLTAAAHDGGARFVARLPREADGIAA